MIGLAPAFQDTFGMRVQVQSNTKKKRGKIRNNHQQQSGTTSPFFWRKLKVNQHKQK